MPALYGDSTVLSAMTRRFLLICSVSSFGMFPRNERGRCVAPVLPPRIPQPAFTTCALNGACVHVEPCCASFLSWAPSKSRGDPQLDEKSSSARPCGLPCAGSFSSPCVRVAYRLSVQNFSSATVIANQLFRVLAKRP